MSTPYIGQIIQVGFNFAPVGWALCNGQLLAIAEYDTLYSLIGTTYGGDGQSTFAVPDLRGRTVIGQGQGTGLTNHVIGERAGSESANLTASQLPVHTHTPTFTNTSSIAATSGNATAQQPSAIMIPGKAIDNDATPDMIPLIYAAPGSTPFVELAQIADSSAAIAISPAGSSISYSKVAPFNTTNWIISLYGIYPTQN